MLKVSSENVYLNDQENFSYLGFIHGQTASRITKDRSFLKRLYTLLEEIQLSPILTATNLSQRCLCSSKVNRELYIRSVEISKYTT